MQLDPIAKHRAAWRTLNQREISGASRPRAPRLAAAVTESAWDGGNEGGLRYRVVSPLLDGISPTFDSQYVDQSAASPLASSAKCTLPPWELQARSGAYLRVHACPAE